MNPLSRLLHFWPLAAALLLGACSALPDKPVRPASYDLGLPAAVTTTAPASANAPSASLPALTLADISASPALDGSAMLYRLAYANPHELRAYAQARWSAPPAQLLRQRLRAALAQQRPVLNPGEAPTPLTLRLELDDFSQVFDQPTQSHAQLRLRATLLHNTATGPRLLAQRLIELQAPAPSPDAPGGVQALTQASEQAAAELARWLQQTPPQ